MWNSFDASRGLLFPAALLALALAAGCSQTGRIPVTGSDAVDSAAEDGILPPDGTVPPDVPFREDLVPQDGIVPPSDVAEDQSGPFGNCCMKDDDCDKGLVCVVLSPILEEPGLCVLPAAEGECWSDFGCPAGMICDGEAVCPCHEPCPGPILPGQCVPEVTPGCCGKDSDCPAGELCVAGQTGTGSCVPVPPKGNCYSAAQCAPGEFCLDPSLCGCNVDCVSVPGICSPVYDGCCFSDADCSSMEVCVLTSDIPENPGACHPAPAPGECYTDIDCGEGMHCEGPGICGCGYDCLWMGPGKCVQDVIPNCCKSDDECPGGMKCVGADLGAGGVCYPMKEPGACFDNSDCGFGNFCVGADICSCDMNCISMLGFCVPGQGGCCMSDAECQDGYVCHVFEPNDPMGGVCEPAPYLPGQCWNDWDCFPGETCMDAWSCPCNADCDGWDQYGFCSGSPEGCCNSDLECPVGQVCVGWELGDAITGTCEPAPAFGKCYYDSDCFEMSQKCVGATVCPCGMLCTAPTTPGTCSPLPGGCCYSDADCKDDEVCRGTSPGSKMPGSCKPDFNQMVGCPPPGGCCWGDEDCLPGKKCVGAQVCGCIELCYACGMCAPDQFGICK